MRRFQKAKPNGRAPVMSLSLLEYGLSIISMCIAVILALRCFVLLQ